jgi:hypothetical protein
MLSRWMRDGIRRLKYIRNEQKAGENANYFHLALKVFKLAKEFLTIRYDTQNGESQRSNHSTKLLL